jgi:polyisoprenoid-binding protein YceI
MKTTLILTLALITSIGAFAQDKYFTRDGMISFFSSTPMEDIKAENHKVTVIMDEANGKMEFSALIKSFEFKKALMEEHFNENYMESNTYKKATFKGAIVGFDASKVTDKPMEVVVKGALTIHGVTKDIEEKGTISKVDGKYVLNAVIKVKPEDYKIEIPNTVRDKIAEELEVTIASTMAIFKK